MRRSGFSFVALATSVPLSLALSAAVAAQSTVAPPAAVQSAPLAPPPVAAMPAQAVPGTPQPAQAPPPAPLPVEPQPVQPPPPPPGPVVPQPVQPAPQAPAEPQPVQPPPSLPVPPSVPAPPPQQQTGAPNPNATLAGKPGDPSDVDEIALIPRNVLVMAGQSSWDQGFQHLARVIATLRQEAARLSLPVAGRPLSLFVQTDDNGFRFEAMLPVARTPEAGAALGNGIRAGQSPAGRALRFVHVAPYDDIDSTYETITAYLEAKGIVVQDAFLEEYVGDLTDAGDPNLEINVYVQPK